MGAQSSETRARLLDLAEAIMRAEGYAAVTSRRLAKDGGMSPQIVYYYFRTMDELFEALFARFAELFTSTLEVAATSDNPLIAIWDLNSEHSRAILMAEFIALANHRKGIRAQIAEFGELYHARQVEIIGADLAKRGVVLDGWTPASLAAVMQNLAHSFALGAVFEIDAHADAIRGTTDWIRSLLSPDGRRPGSVRGHAAVNGQGVPVHET